VVLVEATVGTAGTMTESRCIEGAEPFASASLVAVRSMRFRSACRQGRAVSVAAYLAFGVRSPVMPPKPKGGGP
jgi:hypothetical protein